MKKSNVIYSLFRCTQKKYAKLFIEQGALRFGTIREWATNDNSSLKRVDILEGTFSNLLLETSAKRTEIKPVFRDKQIHFRSKRILDYRGVCFFELCDRHFTHQEEYLDRKMRPVGEISKSYFSGFSEVNIENYKNLDDDEKPSLLIIQPKIFFKRIINYLKANGLQENSDFFIREITYIDKNKRYCINEIFPLELFYKDKYYQEQSEIRIIICSEKFLKTLNNQNGIIHLGYMGDIADVYDYYFEDFQMIKESDNQIVFKLPFPSEPEKLNDIMTIQLIVQAYKDELPERSFTIQERNDYIAPLIKRLKDEYDISFIKEGCVFLTKNGPIYCGRDICKTLIGHGDYFYEKKDFVKAIDAYLKAIDCERLCAEAYYKCGIAFFKIGDSFSAKNYLEKTVLIDKTYENQCKEILLNINN